MVTDNQARRLKKMLSAAGSAIADMVPDHMMGTAIGIYRSLASTAVMAGRFLVIG